MPLTPAYDTIKQVPDDQELIALMMTELDKADELYKPTNYWKFYEKMFLPEIKKNGLYNFRRRRHSLLESFGATDTLLRGRFLPKYKFKGSGRIANFIENILWANPIYPLTGLTSIEPDWVTQYFYRHMQKKFRSINLDLNKCPTSLYGNPEDVAEIDSGYWSFSHLNYCSIIADVAAHINFEKKKFICELGAGAGKNIEILAKLLPDATLLLVDIPPQLYVSNQYLTAVFKERVLAFRKAISLKVEGDNNFYDLIKGKIIILPTWLLPQWRNVKIDLFWNCASFMEMEPHVVKNYLEIVKDMKPEHIYISAELEGNYWGEWKPGRGGTKKPVFSNYYNEYLSDKYRLTKQYDTEYLLRINDQKSYIFERIK
jgi:putative sugar O-methyltransferase